MIRESKDITFGNTVSYPDHRQKGLYDLLLRQGLSWIMVCRSGTIFDFDSLKEDIEAKKRLWIVVDVETGGVIDTSSTR